MTALDHIPTADLWNALLPLRSAASFMMTGAHPDDEASGLIARLAKKDGARMIYVCATRGQGGQNALGAESGDALAAIRTREMEEAARILDMEVHWLDLVDFGFAKTAEATTAAWGEERLLERLVRAIRTARPDVICPTFLDVAGQHGHHRAITRATIAAFDLAADPEAFPEQIAAGLPAWRVAKLYLPAISGAGSAYDDAEPPPPATVSVELGGTDPILRASYAEIGDRSRAFHRSQGMDLTPGKRLTAMPLHLLQSRTTMGNAETSVFDGLKHRLYDFADGSDPALDEALRRADSGIDLAFARFPDRDGVATALHWALEAVEEAEIRLSPPPDALADDLCHRLTIKRRQLWRASRLALGIGARVELPEIVVAGRPMGARLSVVFGEEPVPATLTAVAEDGRSVSGDDLGIAPIVVPPPSPFRSGFDPLSPAAAVTGRLRYVAEKLEIEQTIEPETAPTVVPPLSLTPRPDHLVVRPATGTLRLAIEARNHTGDRIETHLHVGEAAASLTLLPGHAQQVMLDVAAPPVGRHRLAVTADGIEHGRVRSYAYDHIGRTGWIEPATIEVLVADVAVPATVRIGYVDGGGDDVADRLIQLGMDVRRLDADDLGRGDLQRFDTIVIGVRAFGIRSDLAAARERLHEFVRSGGHLMTQYHRPQDGWDRATPLARLEIGSPSVRWRVCDPAAPVTILAPDHPLLAYPNRIGPEDWSGWVKERGLYFASSWDDAYRPLVSLSDPGEPPLSGALLSAEIGRGRHTHVSLALAHQMSELVPGALRIFANLVQPAASR